MPILPPDPRLINVDESLLEAIFEHFTPNVNLIGIHLRDARNILMAVKTGRLGGSRLAGGAGFMALRLPAPIQQVHRARALAVRRELLVRRYTNNAEAYELYLKGRLFLSQSKLASIMKAIGFLQEAIRKDPKYALAYAALADCYQRLPVTSDIPSWEAFPKACVHAENAS